MFNIVQDKGKYILEKFDRLQLTNIFASNKL